MGKGAGHVGGGSGQGDGGREAAGLGVVDHGGGKFA